MKHIFIIVFAIFLLQACGETVSDSPQPTPKDVDHVQLNPKYVHGTYQFNGKVTTEMGTFTSVHTFSGKTTVDTFEIEWVQDTPAFSTKGSLVVNPKGGVMHMVGIEDTNPDPTLAVAAATGVSGGCAHLIYSLWIGDKRSVFQNNQAEDGARSFEVIVDNGMLSSVSDIYDPNLDTKRREAPQMTDDNIKDMLKKMNRPVNDEEIAKIRAHLATANESMKNLHDKIKTTTIVTFSGL
jgi:hypothetical protein